MLSNSKLTDNQKVFRKGMLAALPKGSTMANDGLCLTVLCVPAGNVTKVYTSVCSDDEQKFRRQMGEFWALERRSYGQDGVVLPGVWTADELLESLGGKL